MIARPGGAAPEPGPGPMLWIDPRFGVAGDMLLGALIGIGAPIEAVREGLLRLGIDGWSLEHTAVLRASLRADRAVVEAAPGPTHRRWSTIDADLARARLPDRVRTGARSTFRRLGEVEASIHGVTIDEVHFHEVGALDALIDIVGCWLALDQLGVDLVVAGPVGFGSGTTTAAHGRLPLPAPATAALLAGAPVCSVDVEGETATPTGAALLVTMADRWGPMPAGTLVATARGAGGRDPAGYPNVTTVHLLQPEIPGPTTPEGYRETAPEGYEETEGIQIAEAFELSTNLDDVTAELVGHVIDRALELGADDAWAQPVVMKKSRPGLVLTVLCRADLIETLRDLILAETATLGLRVRPVVKHVADRRSVTVSVDGHEIAVKIGPYGAKPEHDHVVVAARALGRPVRSVAQDALGALQAVSDH